jgi:hypothetical protein
MTTGHPVYRTPTAFRRAAEEHLKRQAKIRSRTLEELRREFLFQRFLARVFRPTETPWVLKGGAGLLVRIPEARYSRDIDLVRSDATVESARDELVGLVRTDLGDHLNFAVSASAKQILGADGLTLSVQALTGATTYDNFRVDLTVDVHIATQPDRYRPRHVINLPGLEDLPEFSLYPLPRQIADKVCAMYDRYGTGESNRYRDLVDLLLIIAKCSFDAGTTRSALIDEANRRNITLPPRLPAPGRSWPSGYSSVARESSLPFSWTNLDTALTVAGECLNPILAEDVTVGCWYPTTASWKVTPDSGGDGD